MFVQFVNGVLLALHVSCGWWLLEASLWSLSFRMQRGPAFAACPNRLGVQERGEGVGNHCLWAREQCKGWVAEICPFLPVTDSLSACEALAAICCCINRQQSELEQLAYGSGQWPFALLSSYSGHHAKIHLEGKDHGKFGS